MPSFFYRFRSTAALLGEFQELQRQEIYFAPSEDLNDGLEGLTNTVWQGDAILWRNVLRHYILVLLVSTMHNLVRTDVNVPVKIGSRVELIDADLADMPLHQIYQDVSAQFLAQPDVEFWIEGLSSRSAVLSREELSSFLGLLHSSAFGLVAGALMRDGMPVLTGPLDLAAHSTDVVELLRARFEMYDRGEEEREILHAILAAQAQEIDLIADVTDPQIVQRAPLLHLLRDFPSEYVRALESMLFPSWATACFVRDPHHSAMWGIYGDGHRGVCLKFRARLGADRCPILTLYRPDPADAQAAPTPRDFMFRPVRYAGDYPETDFFRSLGSLPLYKLTRFWYVNEQGQVSDRVKDILAGSQEWQRDYWDRHALATTTKLPQWAHEAEHRLVMERSRQPGEDGVVQRKLRYDLADLAGVIFGMETTQVEKIAILRILAAKAKEAGGASISFEQAEYSHQAGKIVLKPLKGLSQWFTRNFGARPS